MADNFHHPVFFECHSPLEEHRRKIETYFSIRRRSGGGDCGPLRSVNDKVYSIAFRYKKDQQRVLQRSEHVVELQDGSLVLKVLGSMKPVTSSPDQDLTASAQSIPASTPPASGQEDELRPVLLPDLTTDAEELSESDSTTECYRPSSPQVFKRFTEDFLLPDQVSTTKRIVLLGKTGSGKSSLANTIIGEEELFTTDSSSSSGTIKCKAETRPVNGRSITLIDTPGFFDTNRSEEELKPEVVKCITECAPGPHAFLIVLKVDKFSKHEQDVIEKICQYFSEDALKFAVIVFTHGEDLPEGRTIQEFVSQNKNLSDLVKKCGGPCHVFDNKHWKNKQQNDYRGNQFQVEDLLKTIDKMVMENNGGYYTNKLLQKVEEEIKMEEACIKQSSGNMPQEEVRQKAKTNVFNRFMTYLKGTKMGEVLGAFFGVAAMVGVVITAVLIRM